MSLAWPLSSIIQCVFLCERERERGHITLTHGKVLLFVLFSQVNTSIAHFFSPPMLTLYSNEWQRTFSLSVSVCLLWQHSDTRCFVLFIGEQALVVMPAGNLYRTACLIHSVGGKHPGYSLALFSPFSAERSTYCVKAMHRNKIFINKVSVQIFSYFINTLHYIQSLRFCFERFIIIVNVEIWFCCVMFLCVYFFYQMNVFLILIVILFDNITLEQPW